MCTTMAEASPRGAVVFVGLVTFDTLHAVQITAPPIHDDHIFDHRDKYYSMPPLKAGRTRCFVMGTSASSADVVPGLPVPPGAALKGVQIAFPMQCCPPRNHAPHGSPLCVAGLDRIVYAGATGTGGQAGDAERAAKCAAHTHALRLDPSVDRESQICPESVLAALHLSGASTVRHAALECFDISRVVEHTAGLVISPADPPMAKTAKRQREE